MSRIKYSLCVLVCCLLLPWTSPLIAQDEVDIVFLVDGSGSISGTDFTIQKNGLVAAISSPTLLPRDGTVAVTFVQFGGGAPVVEIPYTLVQSEADVNGIINSIHNMSQIGGSTNPGDAVNTAVSVLSGAARPNAIQSMCLSTDGLPNSGANTAAALSNAQAAGFESFGVIAIEDPPNFFQDDFEQFYGPLVFGGGSVVVVRNAVEFSNAVGLTCFVSESVALVGLEVNQAIQDWTDVVPMIENKTTYVRAFFEPVNANPVPITARLRGFRNGVELANSPLAPVFPGFIVAQPNAASRRNNLFASLNFRLPPSWLTGTVELEVEGFGTGLVCNEAADVDDDCKVTVSFLPSQTPEIKLVNVAWEAGGVTNRANPAEIFELEQRLKAILPAADIDRTNGSMTYPLAGLPNQSLVNVILGFMRYLDLCFSSLGCDRLYYGVIKGPPPVSGLANGIPGTASSGLLVSPPLLIGRNVHAHEMAHSLGIRHATFCDAPDPMAPPFPHSANIGGHLVATIGPMNLGTDRQIFGLDTHRFSAVDPNQHFELMSYCGFTNNAFQWVSDFTYGNLLNAINSIFNLAPSSLDAVAFHKDEDLDEALENRSARPGFTSDPTPPVTERAKISEGFENINNLPGWAAVNNSDIPGTTGWFQGNTAVFNAHAGPADAYIGANFNNTAGTTISNWLITPVLDFSQFDSLSFFTRQNTGSTFPDRLEVRLSTSGSSINVGSQPFDVGDFTNLMISINPNLQVGVYPDQWTQFTINRSDLPTTVGTGRVAFRYFVTNGGPNGANSDYIGIDSFAYTEMGVTNDGFTLVRGLIDLDQNTTDFLPFEFLEPGTNPPAPASGPYLLKMFDSGNNILYQTNFQPQEFHPFGDDPGQALFMLPVPANPAYQRAEVEFNGGNIGSRSASSAAPSIQINFPNGGEVLDGDQVTLAWNAADPNADDLTYSVRYSADGGSNWEVIAADVNTTSLTLDRKLFKESSQGKIRIVANDGFRSTSDESDSAFTVTNNRPEMTPDAPANGARFTGVELLPLKASGHDPEDGMLSDSQISFISDRDGFLGFNNSEVNVNDLSEGVHQITVRATDSGGAVTEQTIGIQIDRTTTVSCAVVVLPAQWPEQSVLDFINSINLFCGSGNP